MSKLIFSIFFLILLNSQQVFSQPLITVYPDQINGNVASVGFSNTSTNDNGAQADGLKNFINGDKIYRDKTAFGKFHRIPVTKNVDMMDVINYDKKIGRTPILLFEMDSITLENINTFLVAHPSYLSSVNWVEIGNEPWNYHILDPKLPDDCKYDADPNKSYRRCKYSFDWRSGLPGEREGEGAKNYANDLVTYINAIRNINSNVKILISAPEGNFPWCCTDAPITQTILDTLQTRNVKIDGLAFHIYAERAYSDYSLKPYPNRYFAIPYAAAIKRWSTYPVCFNQLCPSPKTSYYTSDIPATLRKAIEDSGYNINAKLVLFGTEQALKDDKDGCTQQSIIRPSMLNALVYAGLVTQLSGKVQGILMHQLGYSEGCMNGWDVLNGKGYLLPVGYAVKMLSTIQPLKAKTVLKYIPKFDLLDKNVNLDDDGTIPETSNVPYLYAVASTNKTRSKLSIVIVNNYQSAIYPKINILTGKTISAIAGTQLSSTSYQDNNEISEHIVPKNIATQINLAKFEVPAYSITVLNLSLN